MTLKPGDLHYRAYVGPPEQYDFMGLTQIALLCALGLREYHRALDLGCGSLRAGRLLIPFLNPGNYCGIEPNEWLVSEGIRENLGAELVERKRPRFDCNGDFDCTVFGIHFDFIVAQSIMSHTEVGLARKCVANAARALRPDGLFVSTFVLPRPNAKSIDPAGDRWVYPGLVQMSEPQIDAILNSAGLYSWKLPWFHPAQTWYAASFDPHRLSETDVASLTGYVVGSDMLIRERTKRAAGE